MEFVINNKSIYFFIYLMITTVVHSNISAQILQSGARTTIIDAATISESGSYVLGRDITGPIVIATNDVVLDLNEHTIDGGLHGISMNNVNDIIIKNGAVRNSSMEGILIDTCQHIMLDTVEVGTSGLSGVKVLDSSDVRTLNCCLRENNTDNVITIEGGFRSMSSAQLLLQNTTLEGNAGRAITSDTDAMLIVQGCTVRTTATGIGISLQATGSCCIENCLVEDNDQEGISARLFDALVISGCKITSNGTDGILMLTGTDAIIENNAIYNNAAIGIRVSLAVSNVTIENNSANDNDIGISITAGGSNICVKNNIANNNGDVGISNNSTSASFFLNKAQNNGSMGTTNYTAGTSLGPIALFDLSDQMFTTTVGPFDNISVIP